MRKKKSQRIENEIWNKKAKVVIFSSICTQTFTHKSDNLNYINLSVVAFGIN